MTSGDDDETVDWGAKWVEWSHGVRRTLAHEVLDSIGRLAVLSASTPYVWRGVRDARHSVQPSVFRVPGMATASEAQVAAYETRLLKAASRWRLGHGVETLPTVLSALATIQHHASKSDAIGTRLLDVSTEPLTALWFATEPKSDPVSGRETDGIVFGFRSEGLPHFGTHSDQRGMFDESTQLEGGLSHLFRDSAGGPFVVLPEFPTARMVAQNSLFLASKVPATQRRQGLVRLGFDGLDLGLPSRIHELTENRLQYVAGIGALGRGNPQKPAFVVVVVAADQKRKLRLALETTYGRSAASMFPDAQGFVENWDGV